MSEAHGPPPSSADLLAEAIAAYAAGDEAAAETIHAEIHGPVSLAVHRFLPADHVDRDDLVQDTIVAVFAYLKKNGGFAGNLVKFAITVARNRCRNQVNWRKRWPQTPIEPMADWIGNPDRSPLDLLLDEEVGRIIQQALIDLGPECNAVLRGFYIEGLSIEEIRRRVNLRTVQGVYYRRMVCLEQVAELLKIRLGICSSERGE